jgi:hypothetical protein
VHRPTRLNPICASSSMVRVCPTSTNTDVDEDEISPTSLVHTYMADQWASCKAPRSPPTDDALQRDAVGVHRRGARRRLRPGLVGMMRRGVALQVEI